MRKWGAGAARSWLRKGGAGAARPWFTISSLRAGGVQETEGEGGAMGGATHHLLLEKVGIVHREARDQVVLLHQAGGIGAAAVRQVSGQQCGRGNTHSLRCTGNSAGVAIPQPAGARMWHDLRCEVQAGHCHDGPGRGSAAHLHDNALHELASSLVPLPDQVSQQDGRACRPGCSRPHRHLSQRPRTSLARRAGAQAHPAAAPSLLNHRVAARATPIVTACTAAGNGNGNGSGSAARRPPAPREWPHSSTSNPGWASQTSLSLCSSFSANHLHARRAGRAPLTTSQTMPVDATPGPPARRPASPGGPQDAPVRPATAVRHAAGARVREHVVKVDGACMAAVAPAGSSN